MYVHTYEYVYLYVLYFKIKCVRYSTWRFDTHCEMIATVRITCVFLTQIPFFGCVMKALEISQHISCIQYSVIFFFSLSLFWPMEPLGQGSDPSHSCNLHHSCGNVATPDSLTHYTQPGIEPVSCSCREAANPIAPQ